jgi:hypothetical protein
VPAAVSGEKEKRVGKSVTFQTEVERAAYVAGYNDAIDNACITLRCTGVVAGTTLEMLKAAFDGVATALEESSKIE